MKKHQNDYPPVQHMEYDKKYFLTDCGGYYNFMEYHGLRIDERMSKSLEMANIEPNMHVLDIGSGRGEVVLHCALRKAKAVGIDYSLDAIKLANELRNRYETIGHNIFFLRGNATKLPFKKNMFDRIFLLDVVEHLHKYELNDLFQDLNNLLKKDGIIIIHTAPNKLYYDYGYNIIRFILYLLKGIKIEKDIRSDYEKNMHVNEQTSKYLYQLLKRNGFNSKIRLFDSSHPDFLIRKNLPDHSLSRIILSIINWTFLSQIFCRNIYAIAWMDSQSNFPNYVTNVFDDLDKIHETEYMPYSKDDVIEDMVTDCIIMDKNRIGVIGNGWHQSENWPPAIRWTFSKASAYLKLDETSTKLFIEAITYYPNINVNISIDKQFIKAFFFNDTEWKVLEIDLPDFDTNIIEVLIEVDKTWIPDEVMKNGDTRQLGIAVHKIWLE